MADPRTLGRRLALLLMTLVLHAAAGATDALAQAAQASIAGVVRDASGAVLPGVTVEAASPALIEKVRTVMTDGAGQYRIEQLRTGTYTVTFSLTGFSTVKRDGVVLTGSFSATVSPELRVGARRGDRDGHRRVADRRRAERHQAARHRRRRAGGDSQRPHAVHGRDADSRHEPQQPGRRRHEHHQHHRRQHDDPRQQRQRPARDDRRAVHRQRRAGRSGQQLPAQHGQRAGGRGRLLLRHGRPGHRRRADQHHPARRRQRVHRVPVRHRRQLGASRPTTTPRSCRPAACGRPTR